MVKAVVADEVVEAVGVDAVVDGVVDEVVPTLVRICWMLNAIAGGDVAGDDVLVAVGVEVISWWA